MTAGGRRVADPETEKASVVLNRKCVCVRWWLGTGELRSLDFPALRAAIQKNLPRYTERGRDLAGERLLLAMAGRVREAARLGLE